MYVKFRDSQALIECTVVPNGNIVTMKFPGSVVVDTSGFSLYLDAEGEYDIGGNDYLGFTTIYRNDEETEKYNGYQLSNDGSAWVKPQEPEEPEPYIPTFNEIREQKLSELSANCHESIINGVVIDGLIYEYDYEHQMNIEKLSNAVKLTGLPIGFKADNEDCREYTASEISNIHIQLAMNQYSNQTYFNQVSSYLNSLEENEENKEIIQNYIYGTELTGEYLEHYNKMIELYHAQISAASLITIS